MDLDDLTVPHRWSGTPVYRLAAGTQYYFACDREAGVPFESVWTVAADCLASLDEVTHWIGPLDTRVRTLGDPSRVRAALERDREQAWAQSESLTLRAFSRPDPPRQQFGLALPAPWNRDPRARLVVGDRPSRFVTDADAVVDTVVRQARLLRPHAGFVGFTLLSEPWMEPHHVASALPYLERHPGLNLPYMLEWGAAGAGIPGVDWLTVLGEAPLALIGGVQALRRRLADAAHVVRVPAPVLLEYDGGVVIRAGATPQLGDTAADGAPAAYRAVDAALRPLRWDGRSTSPNALLKVGRVKGLDPVEETRRWATRFE